MTTIKCMNCLRTTTMPEGAHEPAANLFSDYCPDCLPQVRDEIALARLFARHRSARFRQSRTQPAS